LHNKLFSILALSLILVFFSSLDIFPQANAIETMTYNSPTYSITVPIALESTFDKERNTASYKNDNIWIDLSYFRGANELIEDRDEYFNLVSSSLQKSCESSTMEEDSYECTYTLLDTYKTILHDNTVLVVFDQKEIKRSLESNKEDDIKKCYTDTVIVDEGLWALSGCIKITNQQTTNPFIGLSAGIALNSLREAMDSFEPRNAYLVIFDELIEDMDLKVANFIDFSKTPQSYIDRYNNEASYKEWFDENYVGITIDDAVGFPSTGTSQNILKEQGYLHKELLENESEEKSDEITSNDSISKLEQEIKELKEEIRILEIANKKLQETIDDLKNNLVSEIKIKKEIASFVDKTKDPQSYVDRYNKESSYKEWFDENYPDYTIHEAVGKRQPIPDWIKNNAIWWSEGKLSEDEFVGGIEYLVKNNIINVN